MRFIRIQYVNPRILNGNANSISVGCASTNLARFVLDFFIVNRYRNRGTEELIFTSEMRLLYGHISFRWHEYKLARETELAIPHTEPETSTYIVQKEEKRAPTPWMSMEMGRQERMKLMQNFVHA
jgi:predicted acetyltransferase